MPTRRVLALPAFAKLNLDLRVLGRRPDGYHDLRTVFQTLAVHDTVTVAAQRGPLTVTCTDPSVPTDARNLVWQAAVQLARAARCGPARDVHIHLHKRVPAQAGLGGGSADAAVTLLALRRLWALDLDRAALTRVAAALGADVPFFLTGGTALGLGRGDVIYPLDDVPPAWVVLVRPDFGVSTAEAYRWVDEGPAPAADRAGVPPPGWPDWAGAVRNDLEPPVVARHPVIGRTRRALARRGAVLAAMSGSGSAVFGVFASRAGAADAARAVARPGWLVLVTRTLGRAAYRRALRPMLAGR